MHGARRTRGAGGSRGSTGRVLAAALGMLMLGATVQLPAQAAPPEPEPYDPAEFTPILHDLRRAEIVAVGVLPFALLFTAIVYDYAVWAGEGLDPQRVPLIRRWDAEPFTPQEKTGIALAAVGIALAVALVDHLLGAEERQVGRGVRSRSRVPTGSP